MATLNTRIQLKYDTYTNWNTNNPVLMAGELAIAEIPASTGAVPNEPAYLLKVGNGTDHFNDLDWISGKAADVYAWAKAATKPSYQASEITGLEDFIAGEIQDTNTKYQIVQNGNMGFKLQSQEKGAGDWTDVNTITLTAPTYTLDEGSTNGTVAFNGEDVPVHGLGSAAYTESSAYDAAGAADCGDFFSAAHFLPLFDQNFVVVGIGRNPAVVMFDQNQVAETFKFVAGISHGACVGTFDRRAERRFDIDAVIVAAFADGAEVGDDRAFDRPHEFGFALFYRRRGRIAGLFDGFFLAAAPPA